MARGQTLGSILVKMRQEARLSPNPAHNAQARDTHVDALQRTQEMLWEDNSWPHLKVDRYLDLQAGQRFYDPTTTKDVTGAVKNDVSIDRIHEIRVMDGGEWIRLTTAIGSREYSQFQSDRDERSWPVTNWQLYEDQQIEVWPVPSDNADPATREGQLKITATRKLRRFVDDADVADLDDRLLALMTAVEFIADPNLAKYKNGLATRRLMKLQGNLVKQRTFRMFSSAPEGRHLRGPPTVYYRKDK